MARIQPLRNAARSLRMMFHDPTLAIIAGLTASEIGLATAFYRWVEGWRWLDSFYFSVVTIATVGFGDLSPKTDAGKLFTVFYILTGIGLFVTLAAAMANTMITNARGGDAPDKDRPES